MSRSPGTRGQETPVSVFRVERDGEMRPFVSGIMNATGLATDDEGNLYVSSRQEGTVYRVTRGRGVGLRRGHGHRDRNRLRCRAESVCGRPQRNDLQDCAGPADFRLCHAGAECRGVSSGLWDRRHALCVRTDDLELRQCICHRPRRRDDGLLSRPGTARRVWRWTSRAVSTWPRRWAGRRGVVRISHRRAKLRWRCPDRASSASPSYRVAMRCGDE